MACEAAWEIWVPAVSPQLTSSSTAQVLLAMWGFYLTRLSNRARNAEARGADTAETAILLAFTAMQLDEPLCDLVRKFGGDPNARGFMPGMPARVM